MNVLMCIFFKNLFSLYLSFFFCCVHVFILLCSYLFCTLFHEGMLVCAMPLLHVLASHCCQTT